LFRVIAEETTERHHGLVHGVGGHGNSIPDLLKQRVDADYFARTFGKKQK
jgi:hypothetical protein